MQQGGSGSQYGASAALPTQISFGETQQQQQVVEEASPISSRPPAAEQIMRGGMVDEDVLGDDADRGGGSSSGNRWPRQETLALIQIRSQMDAAFRDATVKGPLWEDVSRKLAELGYNRSAKKCKEKFENVHKYYKRTKEGRAGRQDGKSYRFFSQLEALHNVTSPSSTTLNLPSQQPPTTGLDVAPVSVGIPMPMSSQPPPPSTTPVFPPGFATSNINPPPSSLGVSFSSDGSSSSSPSTEDDNDDDETEGLPSTTATRKRKRESHHRGETRQMMEFFEGLMKQVMQKQEAMQQRFLEAIEKREQDRMIREEAWKRQEMARLGREHEMMAQERAVSASRDAAIVSFLQKLTGQTIHLPSPITLSAAPPQPPPQPPPAPQFPVPPVVTTTQPQQHVVQPPPPPPKPSQLSQQDKPQPQLVQRQQPAAASSDIIMAIPEQQVPPPQAHQQQMEIVSMSGGMEAGSSSRWPKAEVIALINLRSGLETRYQEAGPKGPLWEEISAGMQRLGYNRNAKRCKEKWENINKYYKKVKESNKKRPEDSKTCPYFHQLDALYRKKILTSTAEASTVPTTGFAIQSRPEDQRQPENQPLDQVPAANVVQQMQASESQTKNDTSTGTGAATKKPEDIVKELMEEQGPLMADDIGDHESEEDEEEEEEDEGDESETQEERKMDYKIEFQRQNTNGRRNGAPPSFLAMVQ